MEALTVVVVAAGAVTVLERWAHHPLAREAQRHAWRLEVLAARAKVVASDDVEKLAQRVQRLELKGMR